MILAGAGGVNHDELVKLGNQYLNLPPADMDHPLARHMDITPCRYTGMFSEFFKKIFLNYYTE